MFRVSQHPSSGVLKTVPAAGFFAELQKATICPPVCPHETTRLALDRFLWNLIFQYFPKICREKLISLKSDMNNGTLYEDLFICIYDNFAEFFLEWKSSTSDSKENQKRDFIFNILFPKIGPFVRQCGKMGRSRETTDGNNMWPMPFAYWMTKAIDTNSKNLILNVFPWQ